MATHVATTRNIVRLGLPDRFVEHAERGELLADLGLDVPGLCATVRRRLERVGPGEQPVKSGKDTRRSPLAVGRSE